MTDNCTYYIEDACGDKYLFTISGPDYESRFRAFAKGWVAQQRRPNPKRKRNPIFPCKVVVEICNPA